MKIKNMIFLLLGAIKFGVQNGYKKKLNIIFFDFVDDNKKKNSLCSKFGVDFLQGAKMVIKK